MTAHSILHAHARISVQSTGVPLEIIDFMREAALEKLVHMNTPEGFTQVYEGKPKGEETCYLYTTKGNILGGRYIPFLETWECDDDFEEDEKIKAFKPVNPITHVS